MKNLWIIICIPLLLWGCGKIDGEQVSGKPQTSREGGFSIERDEKIRDTSVFVSAFRYVGSGDDWKRNGACAGDGFELVLFKDGVEKFSVPVGADRCVSPDYRMHHIYEEHLYTEFYDSAYTVIGRDGKELFRLAGKETLKGILEKGEDIYTLSAGVAGLGFSYRKNGRLLLENRNAVLLGDFETPSYGQGGALYLDDGCICFSYRSKHLFSYFLVTDGEEQQIVDSTPGILDIRRIGSRVVTAGAESPGGRWLYASLWPSKTSWYRTGIRQDNNNGGMVVSSLADCKDSVISNLERRNLVLYYSERAIIWGIREENGILYLSSPGENEIVVESNCFFFESRCAVQAGLCRLIAVNPQTGCPYYLIGDKVVKMEGLNGFLTGIGLGVNRSTESP